MIYSKIKDVAELLGVKPYEKFKIKASDYGKLLGYEINEDKIFRFDIGLVYKGYDDGWSEWYGYDGDKILYRLILGLYEIVKINDDKEKEI